jgi:nitrogen fixation/metabolism regulation signal transduction histidine kinase
LLSEEDLARVAVLAEDGRILSFAVSALLPGAPTGRWRDFSVQEPLPNGLALEMTFVTRVDFLDDRKELMDVLKEREHVAAFRQSLPRAYRTAFLIVVGGVVLIVTTAGIVLARRLTRRIETLAGTTRDVTAGNLEARANIPGTDELAELSHSFNRMVEQLQRDRQQIVYLQKMSAWQDVARRLAHEIKNPLTPIQLAVQQAVSSYQGDDERFKKTLADAQDIVQEEIAGLRRLVDAFRSLGRLPQAKLQPLDLAIVAQDLERDPAYADKLIVEAPAEPVTVSADRLLLRRVLANLVENGADAAGGAPVHLTWSATGDTATITIDDAGPGVPTEKRDTIFDPYITTKEHGTGLGLAIAKKIALEHRGNLELAPTPAPTGGARFIVTLPLG